MSSTYTLIKGTVPLLISMPHNGEKIPQDIADTMVPSALKVPDTDWHKDKLYDFAKAMGAYIIMPEYNRYVIDLNRDPDGVDLYPGANSTELCPTTGFDLSPLYLDGKTPDENEIQRRIKTYWQPYHQALADTLAEIKGQFGRAVLLEAHSILSHVPRFFEGQLPDFNFGTANGASCTPEMLEQVQSLDYAPYSMVSNGRFKGGFITRHFGQPEQDVHALQLELSQRTYMNEPSPEYNETLAAEVKPKLQALVSALIDFAQQPGQEK
ncbi:N-formylglutamate deformylase [Thalassomonas sp. RHCl1]|uniref:N-formylglutamate deformylase n=1 Tax=Thalassomonas sp. RHCl1 TaxID=2995320 RepID=UPI00248BF210|nr:N-formylglutamate deformylase [Thalassomonas sp. RHCl1]